MKSLAAQCFSAIPPSRIGHREAQNDMSAAILRVNNHDGEDFAKVSEVLGQRLEHGSATSATS
ncbi:hypothetical protein X773_09360 [Mesorhizobium sp. LSJC285A00]|nr:hypothetical protein X773_09360 [Mesorhizobium sp. LSJC285A00]ESX05190.1 hypothetical protein X768_28015 [Mesorhizobium sp. LSJC265A00]ESX15646.1 hypothetical protein X766_25625 [Mesorhizobium sp. LSJC255A00]ESZ54111.1 hypothetical protein X729_29700 [Mesorhizobium sp. L103C131B0]